MELTNAFITINWLSVTVAAFSSFLIGGIWYGPIFGKSWMKEFNFSDEDLKNRNIPRIFGLSFVLAFCAATFLEMFIGIDATLIIGTTAGLLAGVGWVSTFLGILYLFENRSLKAFLINSGYCTISLTLMGSILGVW